MLGHGAGSLPVTEALSKQFLSFPIYAELKPEQVDVVAAELEKALPASRPSTRSVASFSTKRHSSN